MQPLSISLPTSTATTTIPVIADSQYVKWKFVSLQENKNDNGPFLTFTCKLAAPTTSTEGLPINPGDEIGATFWHKVYLYAKNKDTGQVEIDPTTGNPVVPPRAMTAIMNLIDAILNTCDAKHVNDSKNVAKGKTARPDFNEACVAAMLNQTFNAKMRVKSDDFGLKNEFGTLLSEADMPKAT